MVFRLLLAFLFSSTLAFGQMSVGQKMKLAHQYERMGEYDKAAPLFLELYEMGPNRVNYEGYVKSMLGLNEYETLERFIKKEKRKGENRRNPLFDSDLGLVYLRSGDLEKADKTFGKILKDIPANELFIQELGRRFTDMGKDDLAIEVYEEGREIIGNPILFLFELSRLYSQNNQTGKVINEYLNLLEVNGDRIDEVKNNLQDMLSDEEDQLKMKSSLYQRIQKSPDNVRFPELLIWLNLQQKDWDGALIQAKALDRRQKENGFRVMELAKTFSDNRAFDAAESAFKYVASKKDESPYVLRAELELLRVKTEKITTTDYSPTDLIELQSFYNSFFTQYGKSAETAFAMQGLARLEAFYLDNPNRARELLEEAIKLPRISAKTKAECKLELGDVLLFMGDIWEGSLIFMQVEKEFKNDPIGQEAKFRNAKLYFYSGDFEFAKAQLFVLRASTSKMIANDALELGLLIADNSGLDTSTTALEKYAKANLLLYQNKVSEAKDTLEWIQENFPKHFLSDEILFSQAKIELKQGDYQSAIEKLKGIVSEYYDDIMADNALFLIGNIYEEKLNDKDLAMEYYQKLMTDFPGSLFTVEGRKRFRNLRGDTPIN
jgi:tetratricopeptide (TPR) repeat protein